MQKVRYYLELVSIPIFIFIIWELITESVEGLNANFNLGEEFLLIVSSLIFIAFVAIWHIPQLKKLTPCSHEHCHQETNIAHIIATVSLCVHFFPEAVIRYNLWHQSAFSGQSLAYLFGFLSHFLADVIITITISSYWIKAKLIAASIITITSIWWLAFYLAASSSEIISLFENPWGLLVSSFFLSMFVHKPSKPIIHCQDCD